MSAPSKSDGAQRGGFADLAPRVTSAVAMVVAALGALYLGGDVFALFWLLAGFAVNWEWQGLVGGERRIWRVAAGAVAVAASAAFGHTGLAGPAFVVMSACSAVAAALSWPDRRLWAAGGVVYASALTFSVCWLRESADLGLLAIAFLFAVVWGTDVFAYFGGRLIGGPKLAPAISPGKTWSGFWSGVVCGAGFGALAAHFWPNVDAPFLPLFLLGLVAGALAQGGDLFESWIKRRFNLKDSSRLIPGHGGFMDRLDGFIAAAIFAALFGLSRGLPSAAAGLFFWP